jgi:two-component system phosphate regulon sensor histidine kinase PhoR
MSGMFRWRAVLPFIVVTMAVMLGVMLYAPTYLWTTILLIGLFQTLLIGAVAILISRDALQRMNRVAEVIRRLARGDLSARLVPSSRKDLSPFVDAFNRMAGQFEERMSTTAWQRDELAAVLEHMADGVLIADDDGQVRLINRAAARLLGVDVADAVGQSFVQVVRDHNLIDVARACREEHSEQMTSVELSRQDLFLHVIATPLHQNERTTCLMILQDMTQLRRLETVRRDFISNISHELRTPLASLKALVETLRDGALDDPPAAQRFLDRVEAEVDDLTQIVQELLELSRTESGQVPLQLVSTPVADIVLPPTERLQPQAERAGLTLTLDLPADLPPVLADSERMRQVVTNLEHNAIKFTLPGGRVSISAKLAGDQVVISVQDTGTGIPADDLPRIFERFYKADRARSGGGTGLGLAIARHVVQAHGGRIWAESVEGKGSAFYFTLPTASETSIAS